MYMRPIATDVTRSVVCVSVLVTVMYCAITAEPIEMPFGGTDSCHGGPRNHALDRGQERSNPFAAAGMTSRRCGVLPDYFVHLFFVLLNHTLGWRRDVVVTELVVSPKLTYVEPG